MDLPATHAAIQALQQEKLRSLLQELVQSNPFYRPLIEAAGLNPGEVTIDAFCREMPLTTRDDWVDNQISNPPFGTNLTYPLVQYSRLSRTSGSTGTPMNWLDTPESWGAMLGNWNTVYQEAGVTQGDRLFFAFSFGPFLGFWTAFEAAASMGLMSIPGGALTSSTRLSLMQESAATVLCCTPTYALRLAEVAREEERPMGDFAVRLVIVAGEPGGSIQAVRDQISQSWGGALVVDQYGMSEVGPVTYQDLKMPGQLPVMETSYLAEVVDPQTGNPGSALCRGELVLTTLDRAGSPLLRYRTGDLVDAVRPPDGSPGGVFLQLQGGILARIDDMITVRGVNVFPSTVDAIVRSVPGVLEYQVQIRNVRSMTEMTVQVETGPGQKDRSVRNALAAAFAESLSLRIEIESMPPGTLPRYEMKSRRWQQLANST